MRFRITAEDVALVASTTKTVLRGKATALLKLARFGFSTKGTVTSNRPGRLRLVFQSSDGTMSDVTPVRLDSSDVASPPVTAGKNASIEPTLDRVVEPIDVHPQTRYISPEFEGVFVQVGERIALDANFEQNQTATVWMEFLTTGV
jgi:hypothetical protein